MAEIDLPLSIYKFYANLYPQVKEESSPKNQNIVMSPFSLHIALSFVLLGATGETAKQMSHGLCLGNAKNEEIANAYNNLLLSLQNQIKIANKIYVSVINPIKPSFNEVATTKFNSETQGLDFTNSAVAAKTINDWVELKTEKKITNLVSEEMFGQDTRLVLINAVFFIGKWQTPFKEVDTTQQPFFISDSETVDVDMMSKTEILQGAYVKELDSKVIILPYAGGLSMVIVLPNQRTGLDALDIQLKRRNIAGILEEIPSGVKTQISLPKFRIEFQADPLIHLVKMGMTKMSSKEAEFPELLEKDEHVNISNIIHKAFIEVDEYGTVAAASTALFYSRKSSKPALEFLEFKADHPFRFFIQNSESVILFDGCFCGPQ